MDTIHIEAVKQLARIREPATVSIYLPTHLAPDARQDAIRLKNLLERTESELEASGLRSSQAKELLSAVEELPGNEEFWKRLSQGLAIFATREQLRAYRLPLTFAESLTVKPRLNIKPLLPVADRGEQFFILRSITAELHGHHCSLEVA